MGYDPVRNAPSAIAGNQQCRASPHFAIPGPSAAHAGGGTIAAGGTMGTACRGQYGAGVLFPRMLAAGDALAVAGALPGCSGMFGRLPEVAAPRGGVTSGAVHGCRPQASGRA